jgi:hypothetical protein
MAECRPPPGSDDADPDIVHGSAAIVSATAW